MKRTRAQQQSPAIVERAPFACSLSPEPGGFCFSVHLPSEVVAGSPVLAELTSMQGTPVFQKDPECMLAWLAWHAHRHRQVQHADLPAWDAEADALKVRSPRSTLPRVQFQTSRGCLCLGNQACTCRPATDGPARAAELTVWRAVCRRHSTCTVSARAKRWQSG